MRAKSGVSLLTACCLALVAGSCGDNRESADTQTTESTSGLVIASVTAPPNAKCIVITVQQGTTTITTQYNVAADQSSTFNLGGLPEGSDTFSAKAYNVTCANAGSASATYVSDPVTQTVTATPTTLSLQMRPASGATGTVSVNFPNPPGTLAEYTVPSAQNDLFNITAGADGNVWFTELSANKIGQAYVWGYVTEYTLPTAGAGPRGIAAGPDGNVWFTEFYSSKIGRLAIATGTITEYSIPTANAYAYAIAAGPDGNLWFTEGGASKIGRITTGGNITEFPLAAGAYGYAIVGGPDGNIWFTQAAAASIGRITPAGTVTTFSGSAAAGLNNLVVGADGNLWFGELYSNKVAKLTPTGVLTEYTLPNANSQPGYVAAGNDGTVWFMEGANRFGSMTAAGAVTEIPGIGSIAGFVFGSDGNIWALEANKVARVTP